MLILELHLNCVPFTKCKTHINDEYVDNADNLDIIMPMYNLIEYSNKALQEIYGSLKETNKIWTMIQHPLNTNQVF